MTLLVDAREAIYQAFEAGIGATVHTYDNEQFTPPANAPWVRLAMRNQLGRQETMGGVGQRKFERIGTVLVQVFAPLDTGVRVADGIAQTVRNIFEGKTLSGAGYSVNFWGATVREVGIDDGYWQLTVDCPFVYFETK